MDSPQDSLADAVLATARALVGLTAISMQAAPGELSFIQYRALVLLSTRGVMTVSALANSMGLSASSCTRLVERLERKDLVYRKRSPSSRREVNVHLAAKGRRSVEAILSDRRARVEAILDTLPDRERPGIEHAFGLFAEAAGEPLGPASDDEVLPPT